MTELVLRITAKSNGVAPMVRSLSKVMFQTKLEPGCAECRLFSETGKPQSLLYVEQWVTSQALEVQLRSHRFGTLLAIMESAAQAPELELRTVSEQRGLEYVRRIRLPSPVVTAAQNGYGVGIEDPPPEQPQAPKLNP